MVSFTPGTFPQSLALLPNTSDIISKSFENIWFGCSQFWSLKLHAFLMHAERDSSKGIL